jgi:6-phosphogluconolactonase
MISRLNFLSCVLVAFLSLSLGLVGSGRAGDAHTVYVGTYTGAKSEGIYAFTFDPANGTAGNARLVAKTPSPSFLALHPNGRFLYAVNEVGEWHGEKGGGLSAFKIEADGGLTLLNHAPTAGGAPCHLTLDSQGRAVLVANYSGGSVISYRLEADGRIGARASFSQHTGSSVNQRRQEAPHAHGIYLDSQDRFAYVPDLGIDEVVIYRFDATTGELKPNTPAGVKLPPGSGPRHFALHPTKPLAWSLNELLSTVTTLKLNPATGALTAETTVSTLPEGFTGGNSTAEIFVHPGGRFLYASNRGHDSIAVFTIDETSGALSLVQNQPIGGKTPRSFALDPTGRWLLAAAQGSDVVNVFRIDSDSGRLATTPATVAVPVPVCLVFRAH